MRGPAIFLLVIVAVLSLACATSFSPKAIRAEITRQTGSPPADAFEVTVGEVTMALAKALAARSTEGGLPLQGLDRFEVAIYPVPPGTAEGLDFTRMAVRGWEPVVKVKKGPTSGFVLVRSERGDAIGDLVVVAAGAEQVFYGRLRGRLPRALPQALGQAVQEGTPINLRERA
jgi:hypothetical protein